jgi:hypothetical protein
MSHRSSFPILAERSASTPPLMPCVVATEATSPTTASSGHKTPLPRGALAPSHHSPLRPRGAHCEQPPLAIIRANGNIDENHTGTLLLPGPSTCSLHRCFTLPLVSLFGCCALPQTKCPAPTPQNGVLISSVAAALCHRHQGSFPILLFQIWAASSKLKWAGQMWPERHSSPYFFRGVY